jgi:RNA methyltransferase, TrmH family
MDAVNADALFLLDGGVELYHPTVVRASMGTLFWKPVLQTSFDKFIEWARGNDMQLIATSAKADMDYRSLNPKTPGRWCWAMNKKDSPPNNPPPVM